MDIAVGKPLSRIEGPLKVTGNARYAGDYYFPDMVFGYVVNSTTTKGKIISIDTSAALAVPGVIEVFTHLNRPSIAWLDMKYADMDAPPGTPFKPLGDEKVHFNNQPVALVVAETFELARYASTLLDIKYQDEPFKTNLLDHLDKSHKPKKGLASLLRTYPPDPKGDFDSAFGQAATKVSGEYYHGAEYHNPMELFATTTVYDGPGKLTIYDKTQGTINCQMYVCNVFGLKFKDVQVIAPYVGGAFGSGLRPQYQLFMSVMAALELKRPVQVMLNREQMFSFGHRPATMQYARFGADAHGKLTAASHIAKGETSMFEDYSESVANWTGTMYPPENTQMKYELVDLDIHTPIDMRAPGGVTAIHAIECAMDEVAHKLNMDPLELRLLNYTDADTNSGKLFSSKELKKCFETGAERFGWSERPKEPRSRRRENKLVGYGMATGIWEAFHMPARVQATLTPDGILEVSSAVTDIGTGTLTVMTQIAADGLGIDHNNVKFSYGNSKMPFAPIQGGSFTVTTVGTAVKLACELLRKKLFDAVRKAKVQPFTTAKITDIAFRDGYMSLISAPDKKLSFKEVVALVGKPITVKKLGTPKLGTLKYAHATHSAVFVEVEVDEQLGMIDVKRALTVVAAGKIINPKTARSQILGGMVWGISKALREEAIMDFRYGRVMNANLAEYHLPVHADIHDLDVVFVEENDRDNPLGTKGVGEIGIVGMPPAIANAIFNATGKRINDLPIHFDKLL